MRRLLAVLAVSSILAACGSGQHLSTTPTTSAIPNPPFGIYVLTSFPSPPTAILEKDVEPTEAQGSVHLFVTHDFQEFRDITPRAEALPSQRQSALTIGGFGSTSFPTGQDGWIVVANSDHRAGYLLHTTDGGATWNLGSPNALWSGLSGVGSVSFVDPYHGWLAAGNPTSIEQGETFSRTTDGGATWQTILGEAEFNQVLQLHMPSFVSPNVGFATSGAGSANSFIESSDGGLTWASIDLPLRDSGLVSFRNPTFFGSDGVEPVTITASSVRTASPVTIDFDTTTDMGSQWATSATLRTNATPIISIASRDDWWVLSIASTGRLTLRKTTDGGSKWISPPGEGLPLVPLRADRHGGVIGPVTIRAITGSIALAEIRTNPATYETPYLTLDGGAHWRPLTSNLMAVPIGGH